MESETAHILKKLNYFVFNVFFCLFADHDVKRTTSSCVSVKPFDISVSVKTILWVLYFIRNDLLERYLIRTD